MPTLKQLTCNLEWERSSVALQEFQTAYSDGYVETYIAVPDTPIPFCIHLRSNGYIAPGLSMFVYMDGVYQCNRNRQKLRIPDESSRKDHIEIDFRVRQKEQRLSNGTFSGRPWKFNRANISIFLGKPTEKSQIADILPAVADSSTNADKPAPHNGEYVGTIEVVILRCCPPRVPSLGSAEMLVKQGLSSSSVEEPVNVTIHPEVKADPPSGPKPKNKPKSQPKSQLKPQPKAKLKVKRGPFGLDGSWDEPGPSKSTAAEGKKVQHDAWDNWTMPTLPTEDPSNRIPHGWAKPSTLKDESKMGTYQMTNPNEGIYQPVSRGKKAGSEAGSQKGSLKGVSQAASQTGSQSGSRKSSHPDAACLSAKETAQQTPASVHLRGGGSRTQSIRSRDSSGRGSPLVVNNSIVYNGVGTPPPLSAGPPPARQFWANIDAKQKAKDAPLATSKPAAAIDPWGDLPAYDIRTDPGANLGPSANDKVKNWETGGSGMPGSWDASNEPQKNKDAWGTSNDAPEHDKHTWRNTTENDAVQERSKGSGTFDNAGQDFVWDLPKDDAPKNGDSWNDPNDQANGNGKGNGSNWEGNNYNENQQTDSWDNNDNDNNTKPHGWDAGNATNNQHHDTWTTNNAGPAPPKMDKGKSRGRKKGNKSQNQKPTSPKRSKAGPMEEPGLSGPQPTTNKPKAKNPMFNWFSSSSKDVPVAPAPSSPVARRKTSTAGSWQPQSPKSKGLTSPRAAYPLTTNTEPQNHAQVQPSFSIAMQPGAKPYWSTWRDPDTLKETTIDDTVDIPGEAPLYSIAEDLAKRKKMSHQIRPSLPTEYSHKISQPKYMDSHEHPYAVFVFHYRDKAIIEQMLSAPIIEPEVDEKERLRSLPKEQLVEELMKAKSQSSSNGASGSHHSSGKATFKSNPYGIPLGANANALTEKLSKLASSKAPTPEKVGGWLNTADEDENNSGNDGNTWGEANKNETNGNEGYGDAWGNKVDNNQGKTDGHDDYHNDDNNATAGDAWDNNHNNTGADTWGNNDNNKTSPRQSDTNKNAGWGNHNDTGNNNQESQNENQPSDDQKEDDWAASGFDGIDTSWGDDEKKDESGADANGEGGGGGCGGGGGWGW